MINAAVVEKNSALLNSMTMDLFLIILLQVAFAITGDMGEAGVEALYMIRNPDKLAHITLPLS